MVHVLALSLLWLTAPVPAQELSGTVYCEARCPRATVRVFALGGESPPTPETVGKPLISVEVASGEPFTVQVPVRPVRVEISAPGHATGVTALWVFGPRELPPLWLPKASPRTVTVTGGAAKGGVWLVGRVLRTSPGLWRWTIPTTRAEPGKKLTVPVPQGEAGDFIALADSGCFAVGSFGNKNDASVELGCREVAVTVRDTQGRPQPGVFVAGEGTPPGTAARTGGDGTARLHLPEWWRGRVVALGENLGGAARVSGDKAPVVLQPLPQVTLVTAQPYPSLVVEPSWLPAALTGGALVLPGTGGTLPYLEPGGEVQVQAPGYEPTVVPVDAAGKTLGVRLSPQARVAGKVVDGRGFPVPGVPVWSEETEPATFRTARLRGLPRIRPVPTWVSGKDGSFGPFFASPGELRLWAVHPQWGRGDSGTLEVRADTTETVTLVLTPGGSLSLRVLDDRGNPLSGVVVEVRRGRDQGRVRFILRSGVSPEPPLAQAETDREGRASLANLPLGNLELSLKKPGYVPLSQDLTLTPEGKDLGDLSLQPGATVTGRVVDEGGKGIAQALVGAGSTPDFPFEYAAQTEPDGSFQLPDLPREGVFYLQARARGRASTPLKVTMPPAGPVEIHLRGGKTLKGRVVDRETGAPVAQAEVAAGRVLTRGLGGLTVQTAMPLDSVSTDQEGFFEIPLGDSGEVRLDVRAPGYAPAQRTVPIKEDESPRLLIVQLERGLSLRGRVWEADGRPAVGVSVTVRPAGEESLRAVAAVLQRPLATTTDGYGQFSLTGLRAGKVLVEAQSPEGGRDRVTVDLTGDAEVELRLAPPGVLEVKVVGPQGEPIAGAKVELFAPNADSSSRLTDGAGTARFEDVTPGTYFVSAAAEGYAASQEQATVSAQAPAAVTLKLARGGEVLGVVRGLSPQELARCQVWVRTSRAQVSPRDGTFHLKGVPLGQQQLTVSVFPLGKSRQVTVEVKEGIPAQVEVDFSGGVTISGTVRRGTQPVVGYGVVATGPTPLDRASDTTGEGGAFHLAGLAPGSWTVSVSDPNGQVLLSQKVEAQRDTQLTLTLPEGTLSGRIANRSTREPISGAVITVEAPGQPSFLRRTSSDEHGAFTLRELPSGQTFRVRAFAEGYAPAEAQITVQQRAAQVELLLEPQQVVELLVRDVDGTIPGEVFLTVQGATAEPEPVFVTLDRDGRGLITRLAPGPYVGLVQGQGLALVRFAVPSRVQVQLLPRCSLVLEPGGIETRVRLFTAEGVPVPLGTRGLNAAGGGIVLRQSWSTTLPAGLYRLQVERGGQVEERAVTLSPGQETVVNLAP